MYKITSQSGYSLIEVMIAVGILMMAIVAPMTIAVKSIQSSRYTLEQNTATFLAQEALSVVEMTRNHFALQSIHNNNNSHWDWTGGLDDCRDNTGCAFDVRDPYSLFESGNNVIDCDTDGENCRLYYDETWNRSNFRVTGGSAGESSPFIRRVFVDNISDRELTVRVEVEWDSGFLGQEQRVSITSSYFNLYSTL